ncbi:hypothetical protein EZS27_010260, partial [termite gut metagenome]
GANYRNNLFDISLNASISYNKTQNNKQTNSNRETFDYLSGGSTNINLPWQIYLSTDVNYRIKEGYSDCYSSVYYFASYCNLWKH